MAARVSVSTEPGGSRSLQPRNSTHGLITSAQNSLAPNVVTGAAEPKTSGDGVGGREPPTEPRLMRRNIIPSPPQQKSTAHRPIDRRTQHDVYRPSSFRLADLVNRERRVGTSLTWRPSSFHHSDDTGHGPEPQSPSSRTSEHVNGARFRPSQLESSPDQRHGQGEKLASSPPTRRAYENSVARLTSILDGQNATPDDMLMKAFLEGRLDNLGLTRQEINWVLIEKSRGHSSQQGGHDLSNNGDGNSTTSSALALSSATYMNPEVDANSTPKSFGPRDHSSPTAQTTNFGSGIGQGLSSVDTTPFLYFGSHKDMGSAFDKNSATGGSKLSRFSNEETASTSSTTNSRTKSLCRECRTPGSSLTPLVPCTSCDRRYHHSCGNPKPPKGTGANEFVCGKCLKKKRPDRSGTEQSRSTPANADASTLYPTTQAASMPKSLTAAPPHVPTNNQDHYATETQSSQGDLYKSVTCRFWKQDRCNLYEDHCLFAHVETGQDSPSGRHPAKAFTCPAWKAGHCGKSSQECLYSHQDTGLYVGFNHIVSRKHITCYYWKVSGACRHYEQDCPFAHRDTGILAWQPTKDAQTAPGKNSLKNYICPRWEINQTCMWYPTECPYSHSTNAISCLPSATDSRANVRRIESSPERNSKLHPDLPSSSTYVSSSMPIPLGDDLKERENMSRNAPPVEVRTVADAQPPTLAIAPDASRVTSTGDDPPAIGHHPFAGRHMAKRGGRSVRHLPSKQRSDNASKTSLKSPSQHQHNSSVLDTIGGFSSRSYTAETHKTTDKGQQEIHGSSSTAGDTSVKSLPENRVKKCEKCERRILGSANRCVACAATDATQDEDAPGNRSNAIDLELTESAIPGAAPAQKKPQNELDFDESSRRLVAHVRKRTAQDNNLFVSRKKPRISALPINTQPRSLVSSTNLSSVPMTLQANAEKLPAPSRQFPPASTNLSSLQNEVGMRKEGDSRAGPIVPNMTGEESSTQLQSQRPHNICEASSDGGYNHQARGSSHFADHITLASSPRTESLAKIGISQSAATDIPKAPSQDWHPSTSLSKTTSTMEKGSAQGYEKTQAPRERDARVVESDNQTNNARTTRALFLNDNHGRENFKPAAKDRVSSSAKSAETNTLLGIPDRAELIAAPIQGSVSPATSKARCDACRTAHRKCLHRPGGENDGLDPVKCATFLAENPERPINGKFPQTYWLKINQAARLAHQATLGSSALQYRENALEETVALSMTGSSDELMVDGIASIAAEPAPIGQHTSKVGLSPRLTFEHPRLRSQTRAAAIEKPLRNLEEDSDDDLPISLTRRRTRPKEQPEPLEHTATPVAHAPRTSNEKSDRLHTLIKRATSTRQTLPHQGKAQSVWTDDDEQRALESLRERGVKIETDSDSEESFSDDDTPRQVPPLITDRLHHILESRNPFDVDSSLDLRNPENRYRALGKIPPWNRNRPTKKQLIGNLLLYQCRDNKLKFGNPHYNVMRKSGEVPVIAIIENDDIFNTPDEFSGREPETQRVPMTFREFIGMPKQAIVAQGKSKDELVFVERFNDRDRSFLGMSRARRHRDDEVFPFING